MTTVRTYIVPTVIILLAGLIISFAAVPLANTDWAEGFRTDSEEQVTEGERAEEAGAEEEGEGEPAIGGVAAVIVSLVKVTLFMGVGILLTILVRWIIRLVNRFRRRE